MQQICRISGRVFEVSEHERLLREKLGAPLPAQHPLYTFRELLAFWPQLALSRRKCDFSNRDIVSTYDESCPYPVWHRENWLEHAAPPEGQFDPGRGFFDQLWQLFQRCPIPHNIGLANENCEYTGDWWHSKNCYLCHSGIHCEDSYYCFRVVGLKDCQYCVFGYDCQLCSDVLNSHRCYAVIGSINCRNCRDSAFLFDCRNCEHCLFCWNVRNKRYCIGNQQYSKEEYFRLRAQYDFSSRAAYLQAKKRLSQILLEQAYWKALDIEQSTDSSGAYLLHADRAENCFFLSDGQDCVNLFRGHSVKDSVDCVSGFRSELIVYSVLAQENCYQVRFCINVVRSRNVEYCANCHNCENCFACCGLVDKKFCVLNRQLSEEEYGRTVAEIREHLQKSGEYGQFFPGTFAAGCYDESLAGVHFPLLPVEQEKLGFRARNRQVERPALAKDAEDVPDRAEEADASITSQVFWDAEVSRPFQIKQFDLEFSLKNQVPLPYAYYSKRVGEIFSWMPFSGSLRQTTCAISGATIWTNFPKEFDGRLLSEEVYNEYIP